MSGSHSTNRKHRRKGWRTGKGAQEHATREARRRKRKPRTWVCGCPVNKAGTHRPSCPQLREQNPPPVS